MIRGLAIVTIFGTITMPFMSKELRGGKELEGKGGEINIFPRNLFIT